MEEVVLVEQVLNLFMHMDRQIHKLMLEVVAEVVTLLVLEMVGQQEQVHHFLLMVVVEKVRLEVLLELMQQVAAAVVDIIVPVLPVVLVL
jgi:hypothetical protein